MPTESAQATDSQRLRGVKVKGVSPAVDFRPLRHNLAAAQRATFAVNLANHTRH